MIEWNLGDRLHRGVKMAIDNGEASSYEEAMKLFEKYRLVIEVGPDIARSPTRQAMLLTAVNTASRCFLGGVFVAGRVDADLIVPWTNCARVREAVTSLGGRIATDIDPIAPRIIIGDAPAPTNAGEFVVRATFNGWSGGVIPLGDGDRLSEEQEFIPAGVLAGATGVSEAFQFLRGGNALAGRQKMGLSLWRPESKSWDSCDPGPQITLLPSKVWIIGLGHLGQAFLWTLGLLPYANPEEVSIVLHDYDALVPANESTSLLTFPEIVGLKKTRAMADWCEARGFRVSITERRFGPNFTIVDDEPQLALCGVDNALARAALEDVGFKRVIEAGLGKGADEFLRFQMHSFPGPQKARVKWGNIENQTGGEHLHQQPAYKKFQEDGLDDCGLAMLADKSVGVPFVGAITASVVISEAIRMAHGDHQYALIDGSLRSLSGLSAFINDQPEALNLGATAALDPTRRYALRS